MLRSPLLERVLRLSQLKWADGRLMLFKIPMFLGASHIELYNNVLLELNLGHKMAMSLIYETGTFQGVEAFELFSNVYGYSKTISDKGRMLDFQISQAEVAGRGQFKWVKQDFKNKVFVSHGISSYAQLYSKKLGVSSKAVDHQLRGVGAKFVECVIKSPCLCIETKCIAEGDPYCEFVIKPIEQWNKKDKLVIEQSPLRIKKPSKFKIFS